MKFIKYSKYVPDPAGEMSMEDLLNALSDYLLQSGFQDPYDFISFPIRRRPRRLCARRSNRRWRTAISSTRRCASRSSNCAWKANSAR